MLAESIIVGGFVAVLTVGLNTRPKGIASRTRIITECDLNDEDPVAPLQPEPAQVVRCESLGLTQLAESHVRLAELAADAVDQGRSLKGLAFELNLLAMKAAVESARLGKGNEPYEELVQELQQLAGRCSEEIALLAVQNERLHEQALENAQATQGLIEDGDETVPVPAMTSSLQ